MSGTTAKGTVKAVPDDETGVLVFVDIDTTDPGYANLAQIVINMGDGSGDTIWAGQRYTHTLPAQTSNDAVSYTVTFTATDTLGNVATSTLVYTVPSYTETTVNMDTSEPGYGDAVPTPPPRDGVDFDPNNPVIEPQFSKLESAFALEDTSLVGSIKRRYTFESSAHVSGHDDLDGDDGETLTYLWTMVDNCEPLELIQGVPDPIDQSGINVVQINNGASITIGLTVTSTTGMKEYSEQTYSSAGTLESVNGTPRSEAAPKARIRAVRRSPKRFGFRNRSTQGTLTVTRMEFDYGDDSDPYVTTTDVFGDPPRHTYAYHGVYIVRLRLTDSTGQTDEHTTRIHTDVPEDESVPVVNHVSFTTQPSQNPTSFGNIDIIFSVHVQEENQGIENGNPRATRRRAVEGNLFFEWAVFFGDRQGPQPTRLPAGPETATDVTDRIIVPDLRQFELPTRIRCIVTDSSGRFYSYNEDYDPIRFITTPDFRFKLTRELGTKRIKFDASETTPRNGAFFVLSRWTLGNMSREQSILNYPGNPNTPVLTVDLLGMTEALKPVSRVYRAPYNRDQNRKQLTSVKVTFVLVDNLGNTYAKRLMVQIRNWLAPVPRVLVQPTYSGAPGAYRGTPYRPEDIPLKLMQMSSLNSETNVKFQSWEVVVHLFKQGFGPPILQGEASCMYTENEWINAGSDMPYPTNLRSFEVDPTQNDAQGGQNAQGLVLNEEQFQEFEIVMSSAGIFERRYATRITIKNAEAGDKVMIRAAAVDDIGEHAMVSYTALVIPSRPGDPTNFLLHNLTYENTDDPVVLLSEPGFENVRPFPYELTFP